MTLGALAADIIFSCYAVGGRRVLCHYDVFALLLFDCARHRPPIIRATAFLFILSLSPCFVKMQNEDAPLSPRGCKKGSECIKCPWRDAPSAIKVTSFIRLYHYSIKRSRRREMQAFEAPASTKQLYTREFLFGWVRSASLSDASLSHTQNAMMDSAFVMIG
jgi:hypothetical protein